MGGTGEARPETMNTDWENFWKPDWEQTRLRHSEWWAHRGMVINVLSQRESGDRHRLNTQAPFYYWMAGLDTLTPHANAVQARAAWTDPIGRTALAERRLSDIQFYGEAFPFFDAHLGPGNLATFLGSEPEFALDTVWYTPCFAELEQIPPLHFDPNNAWFLVQRAILEHGMAAGQGHFLVGMPDLVENLDILAALRGPQALLIDLIEQADAVKERLREINQVYFSVFEDFFKLIVDPWGGNSFSAFCIWGPGKTAKVLCDVSAMLSSQMVAEFAVPALAEQCEWLDYSMYHLDGTQAIRHLDVLLEIEALDAVEWTPQVGLPQGGDPRWYNLYRRIKVAGKSVQAIGVLPEEVIPLLDTLGPEGMYLMVNLENPSEAEALVKAVEPYR
jgi:hypothetical protein